MPGIYWQNIITLGLLVIQKLFKGFHIYLTLMTLKVCQGYLLDKTYLYTAFHTGIYWQNSITPGLLIIQRSCLKVFIYLTPMTLKVGQGHLLEETI